MTAPLTPRPSCPALYACGEARRELPAPLGLIVLGATGSIGRQTLDLELRSRCRRLRDQLDIDSVDSDLSFSHIVNARSSLDRRHRQYEAAIQIIELLLDNSRNMEVFVSSAALLPF